MMSDSVMVENCTDVLRVGDEPNGPKYKTMWHTAVYRHQTRRYAPFTRKCAIADSGKNAYGELPAAMTTIGIGQID